MSKGCKTKNGGFYMEKVMTDINETKSRQTLSKSMVKGKLKSLRKVSKTYRALQIVRYKTKIGVYKFVKRTVDICAGIVGTMLLIPIMAVVKIAYLKEGDHAPILFKQKRIGKGGKVINIYKIRSMIPNAQEVLKEMLKQEKYREEWKKYQKFEDDPRVTKVGKMLRKTSLDEFPQFIAVLKGDLSLIGPRPLIIGELDEHNGKHEIYESVKPGITGWWGCNGRSATTYEKRLELEYYYAQHCGVWLDIKCIFKTISAVLMKDGAK